MLEVSLVKLVYKRAGSEGFGQSASKLQLTEQDQAISFARLLSLQLSIAFTIMRFFRAILPVVAALSASLTSVVAKPAELPGSTELEVRASALTYPAILASAQSKVATLTPQIQKLIPFNGTTQINVAAVQSVLGQVNAVVVNATSQVKLLVGQPDDQIRGGIDDNTLYYSTLDFITTVGKTIAPAANVSSQVPEIQRSLDTIDQSLTDFGNNVAECFVWFIPLIGIGLIVVGTLLVKWGEKLLEKP